MGRLSRSAAITFLATLTAFVAGIVTSVSSARMLQPADLGKLNFLIWLLASLFLLVDPGMNSAVEKFVAELEGADQRATGNSVTLLLLLLQSCFGLLTGGLLFLFKEEVAGLLGQPSVAPFLPLVALGLPIGLTFGILRRRLAGLQRYDLIGLVSIVCSVFTTIGTLVVLYLGFGIGSLLAVSIIAYALQLLIFAALVWQQHNMLPLAPISLALAKRILRYCVGVMTITTVEAVILQRSGVFFLGRYSTIEQVAYFNLAFNLVGVLVTTLPLTLGSLLLPFLSHSIGRGDQARLQGGYVAAARYTAAFVMPICLGGIAISTPLVQQIYGSGYVAVIWPLRILFVAGLASALSTPGFMLMLALGKPDIASRWTIPLAMSTVVIALALIPSHGAIGAAIAYAIAQILSATAYVIYLGVFHKSHYPLRSVGRIAVTSVVSAGASFAIVTFLSSILGLLVACACAVLIYGVGLLLLKVIQPGELYYIQNVARKLPEPWRHFSLRMLQFVSSA